MKIRFTKGQGKRDTLAAVRDDGTTTWSTVQEGFMSHDLMHYAVETTLGYKQAFYGLLAAGYTIQSFGERDPATGRTPVLPLDAHHAENTVAILWLHRSEDQWPTPAALDDMLAQACAQFDLPPPPAITAGQLSLIHALFHDLCCRWADLPPGRSIEVEFPLKDNAGVSE